MLPVQPLLVSERRLFHILIDHFSLIFSHFLSLKHYSDTSAVNIIIIIIIIIITTTTTTTTTTSTIIIKVLNQQPIQR
jgi:hypothetical protein